MRGGLRRNGTLAVRPDDSPVDQVSSSLRLSVTPSNCLASGGAGFFSVITGHFFASSALSFLNSSCPAGTSSSEKINAELEAAPERVNEDCWDKGWMIVIHADDPKAVETLLEAKSYSEHIASLEH